MSNGSQSSRFTLKNISAGVKRKETLLSANKRNNFYKMYNRQNSENKENRKKYNIQNNYVKCF